MWITNPIALYGWVLIVVSLFSSLPARKAVIVAVMGSFLFLPMSSINLNIPLLPDLNKNTAAAFGLILGGLFFGGNQKYPLKIKAYDIPMMVFCFGAPVLSSVSNKLGLYDGASAAVGNYLSYGVFFWAGRRYFKSLAAIRELVYAMLIGGLICVPLVLFEVRMSPQLHMTIYGFFQHSFLQHFRQGGFRPILFMQHGLMVALWMSVTTTLSFWAWRTKTLSKVWRLPAAIVFLSLAASTVLCKSSGALVFMGMGIGLYFIYIRKRSSAVFRWIFLLVPLYFFLRLSNIITIPQIESFMARFFNEERVGSLMVRILQEDLFGAKAMTRPLLGWARMGRAWPVNADTGMELIRMVDSFWIIILSTLGFIGLLGIYLSLGTGPFLLLKSSGKPKDSEGASDTAFSPEPIVLSVVVLAFVLDTMVNAMIAPIYIVCAGALISYYEHGAEKEPDLAQAT